MFEVTRYSYFLMYYKTKQKCHLFQQNIPIVYEMRLVVLAISANMHPYVHQLIEKSWWKYLLVRHFRDNNDNVLYLYNIIQLVLNLVPIVILRAFRYTRWRTVWLWLYLVSWKMTTKVKTRVYSKEFSTAFINNELSHTCNLYRHLKDVLSNKSILDW